LRAQAAALTARRQSEKDAICLIPQIKAELALTKADAARCEREGDLAPAAARYEPAAGLELRRDAAAKALGDLQAGQRMRKQEVGAEEAAAWRRLVPAGASAGNPDVFRLGSLLALGDVELDLLPFLQAAVAGTGDRAAVHEHVRAALDRDEAVAPAAVEPFHGALRHLDLLVADAAPPSPPWGALATCWWPACHGTRRGV
jgi:hypothetical protein